jgi:hypothetical protein
MSKPLVENIQKTNIGALVLTLLSVNSGKAIPPFRTTNQTRKPPYLLSIHPSIHPSIP